MNIELAEGWTVFTDPKTGSTHLEYVLEEGDKEWITAQFSTIGREDYGTEHHNSASIIVENEEREETVSTRISVADPRGGFLMESRVNETGHYLSVPTDTDGLPHVYDYDPDDPKRQNTAMERRGNGFYKLTTQPAKKANEEEE